MRTEPTTLISKVFFQISGSDSVTGSKSNAPPAQLITTATGLPDRCFARASTLAWSVTSSENASISELLLATSLRRSMRLAAAMT